VRVGSALGNKSPPTAGINKVGLANIGTFPTLLPIHVLLLVVSRGNVVGIATGYGLNDRGVGVRVAVGSRIFSASSRPVLGPTQPPIH
jgi:hypothetical protein